MIVSSIAPHPRRGPLAKPWRGATRCSWHPVAPIRLHAVARAAQTDFPEAKAAGVVLWTEEGTILVGYQPQKRKWSEPGGKRLPGESVRACVERELREETVLAEGLEIDGERGRRLPKSSSRLCLVPSNH